MNACATPRLLAVLLAIAALFLAPLGPAFAAGEADGPAAESTAALLARANKNYEALEYADVIPLTEAVLAREDADVQQRLDAYLLQGSALAVVGDPIDAEKPFRFLLRGRPDFDLPADTSPRIVAVFRKVQVEERAIAQQLEELKRERIIAGLALESEVPAETTGGEPLPFRYLLRDPGRAVAKMSVFYRRDPGAPYSALALTLDDSGTWIAELPGATTENEDGFTLQYYLASADTNGVPLLTRGDPDAPSNVVVLPGTVADAEPIYESVWFWTGVGVVVTGLVVGTAVLYDQSTKLPTTEGLIDLR